MTAESYALMDGALHVYCHAGLRNPGRDLAIATIFLIQFESCLSFNIIKHFILHEKPNVLRGSVEHIE